MIDRDFPVIFLPDILQQTFQIYNYNLIPLEELICKINLIVPIHLGSASRSFY